MYMTKPTASQPLAGCPRCDADRHRTDMRHDSASHFRSTQLKAGKYHPRRAGGKNVIIFAQNLYDCLEDIGTYI